MRKGLYILDECHFDKIYGPDEHRDIESLVDIYAPLQTRESVKAEPSVLHDAEFIFSGWGMPETDKDFLDAAPNLKVVFYGSGTIKYFIRDVFWERGIRITSAYAANGVPVAEYTLSQILFCLKRGWYYARTIKLGGRYIPHEPVPGAYGSVVGIISLGMIGRYVCELLKSFDVRVIAYDPFATRETAASLNVELCSLDDVFKRADVVSLHTPWLKETENMITGEHLMSMKQGAAFINTSRGAVVREGEMIDALQRRPDLQAVLDVTWPEPPVPGSPLYTLPNVILTPHIAGSMSNECGRMGRYMVEELRRYLAGEPMRWEISRERAAILA